MLVESDSFQAEPSKVKVVEQLHPSSQGALDDKEWVVLRYADAMTRSIDVPQSVFDELKKLFSEQEVVEITATVASYNMVSRFLVALDVGECNGQIPDGVEVEQGKR